MRALWGFTGTTAFTGMNWRGMVLALALGSKSGFCTRFLPSLGVGRPGYVAGWVRTSGCGPVER